MSTKYRANVPGKAYFITITTVNWVDLFTRQGLRKIITDSLNYCQKHKGLEVYAYCLMPSHLHLMCRAQDDEQKLYEIIRDFKKFTSKKIVEYIQENPESRREWLLEMFQKACEDLTRDQQYKVWQDGYHAEMLTSNKFIYQKLNYIHMNPVKDGLVENAWDYMFSSARNYADMQGPVEVVVLPAQLITVR